MRRNKRLILQFPERGLAGKCLAGIVLWDQIIFHQGFEEEAEFLHTGAPVSVVGKNQQQQKKNQNTSQLD